MKYTPDNCEILADKVVADMDLDTLMTIAFDYVYAAYMDEPDIFYLDLENYIDDPDIQKAE
jgi:hypothetical protein